MSTEAKKPMATQRREIQESACSQDAMITLSSLQVKAERKPKPGSLNSRLVCQTTYTNLNLECAYFI